MYGIVLYCIAIARVSLQLLVLACSRCTETVKKLDQVLPVLYYKLIYNYGS